MLLCSDAQSFARPEKGIFAADFARENLPYFKSLEVSDINQRVEMVRMHDK